MGANFFEVEMEQDDVDVDEMSYEVMPFFNFLGIALIGRKNW